MPVQRAGAGGRKELVCEGLGLACLVHEVKDAGLNPKSDGED